MSTPLETSRYSSLPEGQFFERKSAFDRSGSEVKRRNAPVLAREIAETLSAMANADGGELLVGMEDDGTVTGVPHPEGKTAMMLKAPGDRNYVQPPLRFQAEIVRTEEGLALLHFRVEWSPEVHRLADGRYVLRVNDANMPFPAEEIAALKTTKGQGLYERSYPPGASLDDVDLELVAALAPKLSSGGSPTAILEHYRLVENRNGRPVPCLACLLLFGKDPLRWHPRCGIDFIRWEGTERKHGAELNIVKRVRVEHPLAVLPERAFEAVQPHIRERQRLQDLFFTEKLEYPTFVWQEAVINAIGHRDYSIHGAPIEVWMFDDHLEIRSPGLPPSPVTVEALNRKEHIHVSRNPLLVRVLAGLGYMRDAGEGIPRMFTEMEEEGFYPPRFGDVGRVFFQVALRNQPVYGRATMDWLRRFDDQQLTGDQKRLLAYAHAHGDRFTSREYQELVGLDIYGASKSIKELIHKGVARSTGKRSRTYVVQDSPSGEVAPPPELQELLPALREMGRIKNRDVRDVLAVEEKAAKRILDRLVMEGWLTREGERRGTSYSLRRGKLSDSLIIDDKR